MVTLLHLVQHFQQFHQQQLTYQHITIDTQQIIHPNTTITVGDLNGAKEIALRLNNDEEFYKYCSKEALYRFSEYYTEEKWLENWKRTNK